MGARSSTGPLDCLFDSDRIDHVVVSTDCDDIYAHGLARGALPIGLRPDSLATDTAAKWDVWQHSLAAVEEHLGQFSIFLDLDCTSPLRIQEDISAAIDLFLSQSPDMVMSCCVAKENPYFNLVEFDETGSFEDFEGTSASGCRAVSRPPWFTSMLLQHT